jgi:membrane peptidoglycan carboxypeptidase
MARRSNCRPRSASRSSARMSRGARPSCSRASLTNGTGTKARAYFNRPAAGKTGTHEGHQQSWFVGYTPPVRNRRLCRHPHQRPLDGRHLDRRQVLPTRLRWRHRRPAVGPDHGRGLRGLAVGRLQGAIRRRALWQPVAVARCDRMSLANAISTLQANGFQGFYLGTQNSTAPAGTVVATAPSGRAAKGTAVGLYTSTGFVPAPPRPPTSPSSPSTPGSPTSPSTPGSPTSPSTSGGGGITSPPPSNGPTTPTGTSTG